MTGIVRGVCRPDEYMNSREIPFEADSDGFRLLAQDHPQGYAWDIVANARHDGEFWWLRFKILIGPVLEGFDGMQVLTLEDEAPFVALLADHGLLETVVFRLGQRQATDQEDRSS